MKSNENFYKWLAHSITELRFLSDYKCDKFKDWDFIHKLAKELKAECRYNSIFINNYQQLVETLKHSEQYNIFIGVNPRRKIFTVSKDGLLRKTFYGGIAGTSHISHILCDIEHSGERKENASEQMIYECIQGAKYLTHAFGIDNYYINVSGHGVHLWIKLDRPLELPIPTFQEINGKIKYNLKEDGIRQFINHYQRFIINANKLIHEYNPKLKVDEGAKDLSRIARPPGSYNMKKGKEKRLVYTAEFNEGLVLYNSNKFASAKTLIDPAFKSEIIISKNISKHRYTKYDLEQAPIVQLLLSKRLPSTLSRNHYLEQSLAKLIHQNQINIEDISELIDRINLIQQKTIQIESAYLADDNTFNPEMVNSYCYGCELPFVYEVMEEYPINESEYLTKEYLEILNNYSDVVINKFAIDLDKKEYTYMELKFLIRELINKNPRATVIITLKKNLSNWEYLYKNDIIRNIINKVRKKL